MGCSLIDERAENNKVEETDSSDQEGSREIYLKLEKLLEEIDIDPRKVLPIENNLRE